MSIGFRNFLQNAGNGCLISCGTADLQGFVRVEMDARKQMPREVKKPTPNASKAAPRQLPRPRRSKPQYIARNNKKKPIVRLLICFGWAYNTSRRAVRTLFQIVHAYLPVIF
jgi:hypothetical protein